MNAEIVAIRAIEDIDLDPLHELLNDSDNQLVVGGSVMPMSKSEVLQWLEAKRKMADTCLFAIKNGEVFCGYVQLVSINKTDGHATLGINFSKQFRRKGFGQPALEQLHDFARNKLLIRKIVLNVRSDNLAAIKLYKSLGYIKAGTLTQHIKTAIGYVDLEIMELIF